MGKMLVAIGSIEFDGDGSEALKAVGNLLDRVLPPVAASLPAAVIDVPALPGPKKRRGGRRRKIDTDVKVPGEPDGFALPPPEPSRPVCVDRSQPKRPRKPFTQDGERTNVNGHRPPGALAAKIIGYLDRTNGVAHLEAIVKHSGAANAHGVNLAVAKCDQLKRLEDGRIALAGYDESQDEE
jgi:hypothetical protein